MAHSYFFKGLYYFLRDITFHYFLHNLIELLMLLNQRIRKNVSIGFPLLVASNMCSDRGFALILPLLFTFFTTFLGLIFLSFIISSLYIGYKNQQQNNSCHNEYIRHHETLFLN